METTSTDKRTAFTRFVDDNEPNLRRALVAWYGPEIGREALAEALAWAWQNWERLSSKDNSPGYLFRVGQSQARRMLRQQRLTVPFKEQYDSRTEGIPWVEPALADAVDSLSRRQRTVVVLVHAFDLSHAETADLLGIRRSTVQNHVERGMARLRELLEVSDSE